MNNLHIHLYSYHAIFNGFQDLFGHDILAFGIDTLGDFHFGYQFPTLPTMPFDYRALTAL